MLVALYDLRDGKNREGGRRRRAAQGVSVTCVHIGNGGQKLTILLGHPVAARAPPDLSPEGGGTFRFRQTGGGRQRDPLLGVGQGGRHGLRERLTAGEKPLAGQQFCFFFFCKQVKMVTKFSHTPLNKNKSFNRFPSSLLKHGLTATKLLLMLLSSPEVRAERSKVRG